MDFLSSSFVTDKSITTGSSIWNKKLQLMSTAFKRETTSFGSWRAFATANVQPMNLAILFMLLLVLVPPSMLTLPLSRPSRVLETSAITLPVLTKLPANNICAIAGTFALTVKGVFTEASLSKTALWIVACFSSQSSATFFIICFGSFWYDAIFTTKMQSDIKFVVFS